MNVPLRGWVPIAATLATLAEPSLAAACRCRGPELGEAWARADIVAEVEIVGVGPAPEGGRGRQWLRWRILQVHKGPRQFGAGVVVRGHHALCNSAGFPLRSLGMRYIGFFRLRDGELSHHYCTPRLPPSTPMPERFNGADPPA